MFLSRRSSNGNKRGLGGRRESGGRLGLATLVRSALLDAVVGAATGYSLMGDLSVKMMLARKPGRERVNGSVEV